MILLDLYYSNSMNSLLIKYHIMILSKEKNNAHMPLPTEQISLLLTSRPEFIHH